MRLRNTKRVAQCGLLICLLASWTTHAEQDAAKGEVSHSSATVSTNQSHSAFLTIGPPTPKAQVRFSMLPEGARHRNSFRGSRFIHLHGRHPSRHFHSHGHRCYWINGGYEVRNIQEWVQGYWIQDYIPPQYKSFELDGRRVQFLVKEGAYEDIFISGHYETAQRHLPLPGYWSCGY